MAKKYAQNNTKSINSLPRKIVIKRILAFSSSYEANKKEKKPIDLLKN